MGGAGAGAGAMAMAMAILWIAAMFLKSDLDGGKDGDWGGPVGVANNNVAWLCAKPEAGSGAVAAGERWRCCSLMREIRCESVLLSRPQRLFVSSGGNDKFACEKLPRGTVL